MMDRHSSAQQEFSTRRNQQAIAGILEQSRKEARHRKQAQDMQEHVIAMARNYKGSATGVGVGREEGEAGREKLQTLEHDNEDLQAKIHQLMDELGQVRHLFVLFNMRRIYTSK